jgi:30S ribosomal protein S31
MGRGDRKSRKGKIFRGSFGVSRPRKTDIAIISPAKKKEVRKDPAFEKEKAVKQSATKKKAPIKKKVAKKSATKKKAPAKKK